MKKLPKSAFSRFNSLDFLILVKKTKVGRAVFSNCGFLSAQRNQFIEL